MNPVSKVEVPTIERIPSIQPHERRKAKKPSITPHVVSRDGNSSLEMVLYLNPSKGYDMCDCCIASLCCPCYIPSHIKQTVNIAQKIRFFKTTLKIAETEYHATQVTAKPLSMTEAVKHFCCCNGPESGEIEIIGEAHGRRNSTFKAQFSRDVTGWISGGKDYLLKLGRLEVCDFLTAQEALWLVDEINDFLGFDIQTNP